jgi:hypothetical protein
MATETTLYTNAAYNVASAGTMVISVSGKHNYTAINTYGNAGQWQLSTYVNGSMYSFVNGSGGITDAPNSQVAISVGPGNYNIRIGWYAVTNIQLLNVNITVQVFKK